MSELEPCRVCGCLPAKVKYCGKPSIQHQCVETAKLSVHISIVGETKEAVTNEWNRRVQPNNDPVYEEKENFIQNKFGYCFYSLGAKPFIYNLYVHPQYRRCGQSRILLSIVINEIRKGGYEGDICIQADPRENSIGLADLTKYYQSLGLTVCTQSALEERNADKHN